VTNITSPLYHLAWGDLPRPEELEKLILASFRTATVAALFFVIIPFNWIFGSHDNLSGSCAFATQWLIHPYAAALFNAYINGGHLLVMKVVAIVFNQRLILTRNNVGGFVRAYAFCHLARLIKYYILDSHPLDLIYQGWAKKLAGIATPTA
jgi:hypothetical protein